MGDRDKSAFNADERQEATLTTPLLKKHQDDVESGRSNYEQRSNQHVEDEWDAAENRNNPRNWKASFKWTTVILVSFIEFMTCEI